MDPLTRTLLTSLDPLLDAATDPDALRSLLFELGISLPDVTSMGTDDPLAGLLDPLAALAVRVDEARADLEGGLDLGEALVLVTSLPGLVGDVLAAARALEQAPALLESADLPGELVEPAVWETALARLPGVLLAQALQQEQPGLYLVLRMVGVVDLDSPASAGELHWSGLAAAVGDPGAALGAALGWGHGPVDPEAIAELLFAASDALGLTLAAGTADELATSPLTYELPLASGDLPGLGFIETGLVVEPVTDTDGVASGLAVAPYALGAAPTRIGGADGAFAELTATGDGTRLVLQPRRAPTLQGSEPTFEVAVGATFASPALVFGVDGLGVTATGFRLVARWADGAVEIELDTSPGLTFGLGLGDNFLRTLFGGASSVTVDAGLIWRPGEALRFSAGNGLALELPLNRTIGPVTIERVGLMVDLDEPLSFSLTAGVSASLGPLWFSVEGIGLSVELITVQGSLCPSVRAEPPTRVVVLVTSEGVNGGGFLEIDPENGRYAGGLALDIFGFGLSAIVIVDTEPPGSAEWALFGSLGLEFPNPIPIGFGFTLNGVGGLLALNRTIDIDALAGSLSTGAADAILFPDNLEEDADAVLAGLDSWFPVQDGSTVFGPVVLIGWGSPETLITAQLGVIIALPDLVIALLGSVEVLLPTPEEAVLSLRMDILGAVDIPASTVIVAASLHDSNLLGIFELSGDMGFYARTAEQPLFVLSIGGYHPQFDPPGCLPCWLLDLRKTRAAVELGDNVEIVLTSYVAVTSNTFQFGGSFRLEASVEVALTTYSAEGWFGVNVLLVLKPFKIVARATAGVSISAGEKELFGVDLAARVEGPQPWYATGRATFTFFGFDVDFGFDVGTRPGGEPREVHDVCPDVVEALEAPAAWEPVEPADPWSRGVIVGDQLPEGLWVRPDQVVVARQSIAPLNRSMTAFGEATPATDRVDVGDVTLGATTIASPDWVDDWFAPAQFDRLDDNSRLSAPSYEMMTAGVRFGDDGIATSADPVAECASVSRLPEESIYPDRPPAVAGYLSPTRVSGARPTARTVVGPKLSVKPTAYTLVRTSDGGRADAVLDDAGVGAALRYATAVGVLAGRPSADRARLKIVPAHAAVEVPS